MAGSAAATEPDRRAASAACFFGKTMCMVRCFKCGLGIRRYTDMAWRSVCSRSCS